MNQALAVLLTAEAVAGAVAAAALVAALVTSPLFRNVALAVLAASACIAYVQGGGEALAAVAGEVMDDLAAHPGFRDGLVAGAAFTAILLAALRIGRGPRQDIHE